MKTSKQRVMGVLSSSILSALLMLVLFSCSSEEFDGTAEDQLFYSESISLEAKAAKATSWQEQIEILEQKMRRFHNFQVAQAQGYTELVGPPPIAGGPYVPNMGYHYRNPDLLGDGFNLLEPEILVYHPDENGNLVFGAAEYLDLIDGFSPAPMDSCIVPDDAIAPEGFIGDADHWMANCPAGGWTLHAWVGTYNPDGVFAHNNPDVPATAN